MSLSDLGLKGCCLALQLACAFMPSLPRVSTHCFWGESEDESHSVLSDSLRLHGLYTPWNSPGQNTGVGSLSLLQGIFLAQGSNPGLPHCRQILYLLSHKGSPRVLEWVAYPFSRGPSQPRNQTCIAGGFFTNCTETKVPPACLGSGSRVRQQEREEQIEIPSAGGAG